MSKMLADYSEAAEDLALLRRIQFHTRAEAQAEASKLIGTPHPRFKGLTCEVCSLHYADGTWWLHARYEWVVGVNFGPLRRMIEEAG